MNDNMINEKNSTPSWELIPGPADLEFTMSTTVPISHPIFTVHNIVSY